MKKYLNKPTLVGDLKFDSKAEAKRWQELTLLQRVGEIDDLERQKSFELAPGVKFEGAKRATPPLRFIADFSYTEWIGGKKCQVVEDVKSPATTKLAAFRIKRHLMRHLFGIDIRVTS